MPSVAKAVQYIVPIVGMLSAFLVALAIAAAHRVIERLKPVRQALEDLGTQRGYERLGVDTESRDHTFGNLPSKFLPWLVAASWAVLLALVARLQ